MNPELDELHFTTSLLTNARSQPNHISMINGLRVYYRLLRDNLAERIAFLDQIANNGPTDFGPYIQAITRILHEME